MENGTNNEINNEINNEMNNETATFAYTYSAKQQAEIKRIRGKYAPAENKEDKMELLRRMDAGVTQKASAASLAVGILSALVLGVGMCCCMVWDMLLVGIIIGAAGICGVALAYPVYNYAVKKERQRIAPEIIRLTDELMK